MSSVRPPVGFIVIVLAIIPALLNSEI